MIGVLVDIRCKGWLLHLLCHDLWHAGVIEQVGAPFVSKDLTECLIDSFPPLRMESRITVLSNDLITSLELLLSKDLLHVRHELISVVQFQLHFLVLQIEVVRDRLVLLVEVHAILLDFLS